MSKRVIGYEGEGRRRRPTLVDEGPSSAAGLDKIALLGALPTPGDLAAPLAISLGAGPIERRLATPEELAAARAREQQPSLLVTRDGRPEKPSPALQPRGLAGRTDLRPLGSDAYVESARRGAAVSRAQRLARPGSLTAQSRGRPAAEPLAAAPSPATAPGKPTRPLYEPSPGGAVVSEMPRAVEPQAEPSATPFTRLAQAAQDAAVAKATKDAADRAWEVAQEALEAAWREVKGTDGPARLEAGGVVRSKPARLAHRRPNTAQESRANGTAAMLAKRKPKATNGAAPKDDVPTGGGPGPMPPFLRRMLDALVEADGDRTAAASKLGIKRTSLVGTLGKLRRRPDLTARERAVVSSSRA